VSSEHELALLPAGKIVGERYRIVRRIGAGGMGTVYEAEHTELGKRVALKMMLPSASTKKELVQLS
jgi:serine/threonine-protein kinase